MNAYTIKTIEIVEHDLARVYQGSEWQIVVNGVPMIAFDNRSDAELARIIMLRGQLPEDPQEWYRVRNGQEADK